MRHKAVLAAIAVAAVVAVPVAVGKGKPTPTGAGCRPQVALIVRGTATSDATTSQLKLNITGGNKFAKVFKGTTTAATVNTGPSTKVTSGGEVSTLTSIKSGDRVLVMYRVCKADVKGKNATDLATFTSTLTPKKVVNLGSKKD